LIGILLLVKESFGVVVGMIVTWGLTRSIAAPEMRPLGIAKIMLKCTKSTRESQTLFFLGQQSVVVSELFYSGCFFYVAVVSVSWSKVDPYMRTRDHVRSDSNRTRAFTSIVEGVHKVAVLVTQSSGRHNCQKFKKKIDYCK
jgi:hypothetical protein